MKNEADRLYELLPVVYRQRDAEQGFPLRALLRVIGEQVDVVERDVARLYDNWFIETCDDWVVPYIGDLLGYRLIHDPGLTGDVQSERGRHRHRILIPRRDVANTIRYRRRKGTLALLEQLANDVAGWPARAVEFYKLLGLTQALNHLRLSQGRTVDLRTGEALDLLDSPFDELAHTVDVRRIASRYTSGRYNIPNIGLFVWRIRPYSVSRSRAYCHDRLPHTYAFSALGNDIPLFALPEHESTPTQIAGERNLPVPIRRKRFRSHLLDYYGEAKSLQMWRGLPRQIIPPEQIVVADLTDWQYEPKHGRIAVDPELGRIAFHSGEAPQDDLWVTYYYGFSADIGGGEYHRVLSQPVKYKLYRVGEEEDLREINAALALWQEELGGADPQEQEELRNAVIEVTDSRDYVEQVDIAIAEGQSLQIRAANRRRPLIRLLDYHTGRPDYLRVKGETGSQFTLDGILITGRGVHIDGKPEAVAIRHSTLVPGWEIDTDCVPQWPEEPSLELYGECECLTVEASIIGSIQVQRDEVRTDPIVIHLSDSILDATSPDLEALGAPGNRWAHSVLTILRSTVFGEIQTHAIELAENSIFQGPVKVARRQRGCMRFCYIAPGSRTPRRYNCQPDLVERAIAAKLDPSEVPEAVIERATRCEQQRVRPVFNSTTYGTPTYCQLAHTCAEEIQRGAEDQSEMGVFHDLYQPQRHDNLRARLDEYTPAGMGAGLIYAS